MYKFKVRVSGNDSVVSSYNSVCTDYFFEEHGVRFVGINDELLLFVPYCSILSIENMDKTSVLKQ